MKKLNHRRLLVICALMAGLCACTPKYGAHFSATDNFYQPESTPNQTVKQTMPPETSEIQKDALNVRENQLTASKTPIYPIPNPSIEKLVKKHQQQVREIEEKGLEGKELSKALKKVQKRNRREVIREVKNELKEIKELQAPNDDEYVLMMILAVLIPPLAVGLTYGVTDKFWISLLLTLLFYIPGMVYALIVVNDYYR